MFDQNKLLHYQQQKKPELIQSSPIQQEENQFASALLDQDLQNKQLQESRFTFWGVSYRDGAEMTAVKQSMAALNQLMRTRLSLDKASFEQELAHLLGSYQQVITNCRTYVASHRHPITKSGKARLSMVRKILAQTEHELAQLPVAADRLFQTNQKDLLWGNILGMAREMDVDLDKADKVELGGAGTSDVTIITAGQTKLFFKETEQLCSSQEEIQRQYIDTCKDEQDLAIYQELKGLMVNDASQMSAVVLNNKNIFHYQPISSNQEFNALSRSRICELLSHLPRLYSPFTFPSTIYITLVHFDATFIS